MVSGDDESNEKTPGNPPGEPKILTFKPRQPPQINESYTRTCGECGCPMWHNHFDDLGNKWHECANIYCQALYDQDYEPLESE